MFQQLEEKSLLKFLEKFDKVPFAVKFKDGKEHLIGTGKPQFTIKFNKMIPISSLLENTNLAFGEAYMNKDIEIEGDLYETLVALLSQMDKFSFDQTKFTKFLHPLLSKSKQSENIHCHYDIGNDFYKLWLDPSLSYSCAYFKHPDDTLAQAQINKIDYILEKLYLKEGMHLLDIGCGWGGLLIRAAQQYKVKGVGITLSEEQFAGATARVKEAGLEDLITIKIMDYRDVKSLGIDFERVVSVGMLEHVGRDNYQLFMDSINSVLAPGGLLLLHYISQLNEVSNYGWIQKYIFPGGQIPSLREMINDMGEDDFHVLDVENLRRHYNKTLLCWADNFNKNLPTIEKMFNETFIRMWSLYLYGCAASFWVGDIELHQILASKGINNDLPMTRWY